LRKAASTKSESTKAASVIRPNQLVRPKRNRKWRNLEARLLRLKEEYVNGIRNLEDYWNAVCNCVVSF